jgi:photosystem II stability/assembly factor-like uncharacterized protein
MKKINFKYGIPILLILAIGVFYTSQDRASRTGGNESSLLEEYPNEHMYNQRAYPDNYINRSAIRTAVETSKTILNNRNSKSGSDWIQIGPLNTGGRITDVAISPDNDDHLYVTTAVGGVFRSLDRGLNWTPIFDAIGQPSIGNIAIAPSNAQRIYIGTGEANGSATSGAFFGDGIYRSDDGGDTWINAGLAESNHIGRIVVDPADPDRVFVAATGVLYGTNDERGIYRTTNGGTTWEQVLFVSDETAAIDLVQNSANPDILYAAMWERTRQPWQRSYAGLNSAIHRSTDGGNTWTELGAVNGLPAPDSQTGRIGLAISESDPATLYARFTTNEITNVFNGLYKSSDNGDNWTLVTLTDLEGIDSSFGWYFGNIRVNPINPDEVFVLGQLIFRTTNSGTTWNQIGGMHVDHHALEYSRNDPNFVLAGNDGGAYTSTNGGANWQKFTNLPITQFYNIEVDYSDPTRLYGGTQDNNTIRTLTGGTNDWASIVGGDGFHVNVDPNDNSFIYAESQFGNLRRSIDGGNNFTNATDGIDGNDRTNWNTPVILSPFDSEVVYYGSNKLYSSDKAVLWTAISPDLTDGEHPSGALSYGTLTAIAASYNNLDVIYTGSDDGNVQVTFDGGASWTNISAGLPDRYVTSIATIPNDDNTAYVTFSGFTELDYAAHVFKTVDSGQNWTDISANLPGIPVNDIITFPAANVLFVATDLNVWYSLDDGTNWDILGNDLPLTIIRDLKIHAPTNTLYAGSFGRSMHKYDIGNIVLGANESAFNSEDIKIYPVPARTQFTIEHNLSSEGIVKLYDISGKEIETLFEGKFGDSKKINISTEGLADGHYVVKIMSGSQSFSKQILIKK